MPTYNFEAMNAVGEEIRDTVIADNVDDASAKVRARGYFITKIQESIEKAYKEYDTTIFDTTMFILISTYVVTFLIGLFIGMCL